MNNNTKKYQKANRHAQKGYRFHQQGKIEKAKTEFVKAIKLQKNHFDALQSLGAVCLQQQDYASAIDYLTAACGVNPNVAALQCNLGLAYRYTNNPEKAVSCFEQAINIDPNFGAAFYNLALYQIANHELNTALETLQRAEHCRPGHLGTLEQMAHVLESLNQFSQAIPYYMHALKIEPENTRLLFAYGKALQSDRQFIAAVEIFKKTLSIDPELQDVRAKLADLLEAINKPDEAEQYAEEVLVTQPQHKLATIVLARIDRRKRVYASAKKRLSLLTEEVVGEETDFDAAAQTELGLVLDHLEEYRPAYAAFSKANKIMGQLPSAAIINRHIAFELIEAYDKYLSLSAKANKATKHFNDAHPTPIFLVGFPRSGTTLTEQILATNENIITGDELNTLHLLIANISELLGRTINYPQCLDTLESADILKLRKYYWDNTKAAMGVDSLTGNFVDKLPLNIIHLALIEKIFPDAQIIVALRDPRDVCVSCFMQLFQLNESMIQFLDMDTTVDYYSAVMNLWLKYRTQSSLHWIESRYEDLVDDVETSTRRLNEFLGEDNEAAVEAFHQQASRRIISTPSYQDVGTAIYQRAKGRWKNYQAFIEEPLSKLDPLLKAFGYI